MHMHHVRMRMHIMHMQVTSRSSALSMHMYHVRMQVGSETIVAGVPWYSAAFAKGDDAQRASLIGTTVSGIHEVCDHAVAAHTASELPWLTSVGWDAMITDNGPVFFEGNVGSMRAPRRIFLDSISLELWMSEVGLAPRWARK